MVVTRARERQKANLNSTIYLLPTEVFAHILLFSVSDDPEHWTIRPLKRLLSTAGRFRDIAFNTPSLWPYLSSSTSHGWRNAILKYNSEGPLAVILRMSDTIGNRMQLEALIKLHSRRCTALWLETKMSYRGDFGGGEYVGLDQMWPLVSPNATDLNIRDFSGSRRETVVNIGEGPPLLSLSLHGMSFKSGGDAAMCKHVPNTKETAGLKWLSLDTLHRVTPSIYTSQYYQADLSDDALDESIRLQLVGLRLRCVEGALLKAIFLSIAMESLKYVELVGTSVGLEVIFDIWATKRRNTPQDLRGPALAKLTAALSRGWDIFVTIPSAFDSLPPWNIGLQQISAGVTLDVRSELTIQKTLLPGLKNFCSTVFKDCGVILQVIADNFWVSPPPYRFFELFPSLEEINCNDRFSFLPMLEEFCHSNVPQEPAYPSLYTLTGFAESNPHGEGSLSDALETFANNRATHMKAHRRPGTLPQWTIESIDSGRDSKVTMSLGAGKLSSYLGPGN